MSRFWESNHRFIQVAAAGAALFLTLHFAVVHVMANQASRLDADIEKIGIQAREHRPPAGEEIHRRIRYLRQENERLRKNHAELTQALEAAFPRWADPRHIPTGVRVAEHFHRRHAEIKDQIEELYLLHGVSLEDEHLGFDPEKIRRLSGKEALENLKKLAMVEKLVRLLMLARVSRIITVKPEEIQLTGALRPVTSPGSRRPGQMARYPPFIREIPVQIVVVAPVDALMRFLHSVRRKDNFLMIRNIQIHNRHAKGLDVTGEYDKLLENELLITITAAGMSFLSEKEVQEQIAKDPSLNPARFQLKKIKGKVPPIGP